MNQNDEFTKHDERFIHEDEYNRDYEMELHKKDSFTNIITTLPHKKSRAIAPDRNKYHKAPYGK